MFKCVFITAMKVVLAAQITSHTAEPNYRPLFFFIIICMKSKMSDADMSNRVMKIIRMNHKYKLVVLFSSILSSCFHVCIHAAHLLQTTRTPELNCISIRNCNCDGEEY